MLNKFLTDLDVIDQKMFKSNNQVFVPNLDINNFIYSFIYLSYNNNTTTLCLILLSRLCFLTILGIAIKTNKLHIQIINSKLIVNSLNCNNETVHS